MSILVYDEIWVRAPRLMVPRQKPFGPVIPDPRYGACVALVGLDGYRERTSGAVPSYNTNFSLGVYSGQTAFLSSSQSDTTGLAWPVPAALATVTGLGFTFLAIHAPIYRVNSDFIFSRSAPLGSANYDWGLYWSSAGISAHAYNENNHGASVLSPLAVSGGRRCDVVVVKGSTVTIFSAGASASVSLASSATIRKSQSYIGSSYWGIGTQYLIAHLECGAAFNCAWPDALAAEVSMNWYQWLIPA